MGAWTRLSARASCVFTLLLIAAAARADVLVTKNGRVLEGKVTEKDANTYHVKLKTVEFDLESPDDIHSFWVPAFLFKRDVIPGIPEGNKGRKFQITTLDKPGVYAGRCAELCGVDHSRMLFSVKLVPQAEYDQYIATQSGSAQ